MKPESFQNNFCLGAVLYQDARFPLTPAVSLGERENRSPSQGMAAAGFSSTTNEISMSGQRLFPLLRGEGQGEGKTINQNSTLAIVL
jgi:hypothetical protein